MLSAFVKLQSNGALGPRAGGNSTDPDGVHYVWAHNGAAIAGIFLCFALLWWWFDLHHKDQDDDSAENEPPREN